MPPSARSWRRRRGRSIAMSRPYTKKEMRELFLDEIWNSVDCWREAVSDGTRTPDDALAGLAFSILVQLDGQTAGGPSYALIPQPHPSRQSRSRGRGRRVLLPRRRRRHHRKHDAARPVLRAQARRKIKPSCLSASTSSAYFRLSTA